MRGRAGGRVFPASRARRLRRTGALRDIVSETRLSADDLVAPVFIDEGAQEPAEVPSMPGIRRVPPRMAAGEACRIADAGIKSTMVFGLPSSKDDGGSQAYAERGVVQEAVRGIRGALGDRLAVMTDVCLCQYTASGHCGLAKDGAILNDESNGVLAKIAVSHAEAGADAVCPSAMMDGQVAAIRAALDDAGMHDAAVMSHSAKHRSSLYSPFRDAAECAPRFGDRKTYQVPYTNAREALREMAADVEEGVDIVMVKPALAYLDLIYRARRRFDVPVAAYSVSGEYALVSAAARMGWLDADEAALEVLSSIKRAGADIIVTYFAERAAALLGEGR